MGSGVTVCFYLMIGTGVAVALWLGEGPHLESDRLFRTLTAPFFWPLYLPVLLTGPSVQGIAAMPPLPKSTQVNEDDGMASLIAQVETELDTALRSLDGWAEDVLSGEKHRIGELRTAWHQQASHIRELDQLLRQTAVPGEAPAISPEPIIGDVDPGEVKPSRISECEKSRLENIRKLKHVRRKMYEDLMATLAWVRQLVTMIHLAKFTGAPASRALELVQQIAAAVEGVSEVNQYTSRSPD